MSSPACSGSRPFVAGSFGPLPRFGVATGGLAGVRVGRARIEALAIWEAPQRAHDQASGRSDAVDAAGRPRRTTSSRTAKATAAATTTLTVSTLST